ncbi:phosphate acetyltransferase [Chloroflexota bacterium]
MHLPLETKVIPKRVVFTEGSEERILRAAVLAADHKIAFPILLGKETKILGLSRRHGLDIGEVVVIEPISSQKLDDYVKVYSRKRDIPSGAASNILREALYFGAMMVSQGDADALVSGIAHATEDIVMASELIIGLQKDISTPSSFLLMDIPSYSDDKGKLLLFADAAVNPEPNPEQLADIAIATAHSAAELLGWKPRVAMLSFSTKGSAFHPLVDKVVQAVELVKKRRPELAIDGELQVDAALVPEVAAQKIEGDSRVAGTANILIFPDLNSANIGYKLVQRLAGAKAYGPVLQGFAKPVSDLSRGASVEDILGATLMVVKGAQV